MWLITGGLGYIGAHVADEFLTGGKEVVVFDSGVNGFKHRLEFLQKKHNREIPLVISDIRDIAMFERTLEYFQPKGIVHTAALKSVEESYLHRDEYFDVNAAATRTMLESLSVYGIRNFIFSSSAAVYGSPNLIEPLKETEETKPVSPYGLSKLAAENEVIKFSNTRGNNGTSLRFFNVIGTGSPQLLDKSSGNIVPKVIEDIKNRRPPVIFGNDYPTPDGTCIRDYVDVRDVARAHLAVATNKTLLPQALNVGTGQGKSVREMIRLIGKSLGLNDVDTIEADRRMGDPSFICADVSLIRETLGFKSSKSVEEGIASLFTS